ncbi:MAG: DoxX family protein [Gammaproteobacteria bacterium]|jgi:putative oxidoreductase
MEALLAGLGLDSGIDYLRVLCGVFLVPHLVVKFQSQEFVKGFMEQAGLRPPIAWLYASFAIEIVATLGLVLDIYTAYAAILAGVFLVVASWASWRVSKGKWMWNFGGAEYPLFWAICCFIVAAGA